MKEAGVLIDLAGNPFHWHMPLNRTVVSLPDNRDLWDVIWDNRKNLSGIGHSHPGDGVPGPSYTDVTTFAAIEAALGARLNWWITSETHIILAHFEGPHKTHYVSRIIDETSWSMELRNRSTAG